MQMRILLVVVLAQLVPSEVTGNNTEESREKIIYGVPAKPGRYQAVVALQIWRNKKRSWCTGSVLNNNTVITAGHCLLNATTIKIYVNCLEVKTCQQIRLGNGYIHEKMQQINNFTINDLGMVKTSQSLGARRFVRLGQPAQFYKNCNVVGYGRIFKSSCPDYRRLYWLRARKIMPCSVFYPQDQRFNATLCSIVQLGKQFYRGDSGGPLFCGRNLVGVTSQLVNLGSERNETLMVWMIPVEYAQWISVTSTSNQQSALEILLFPLYPFILLAGIFENCL